MLQHFFLPALSFPEDAGSKAHSQGLNIIAPEKIALDFNTRLFARTRPNTNKQNLKQDATKNSVLIIMISVLAQNLGVG